jgi:hypothetical protein
MREIRNTYIIFCIGIIDRKRKLGKQRLRWGYNIKMELREIGLQGVDWIHLKIGAGDGIL